MPKAFPAEFHRDVLAAGRKREAPISQVAKDFGISEATLQARLRPGLTEADAKEVREYKNRVRLSEPESVSPTTTCALNPSMASLTVGP